MLVKARKQIISNPQAVHEVLSKVLSAENEVDRMKEHLKGHIGYTNEGHSLGTGHEQNREARTV